MLSLDKLYPQLSNAQKNGIFDELEDIYGAVPQTSCERCSVCCTVPSPAYLVEYLYMFNYMKNNLAEQLPDLFERAVRYYFLELLDINLKCPFVNPSDNSCLIYPARPLSCRSYGLLKSKAGDGYQKEMRNLAVRFKEEHGIVLPQEIIDYQVPSCGSVKLTEGGKVPREFLEVSISYVARLETKVLSVPVVETEQTFMPHATHLAMTLLSKGAVMRKVKVMKEYLEQGQSSLLEQYANAARSFQI